MQDQINLDEITDLNELNKLYVTCNESLMQAQADTQRHTQNLQNIRGRMAQVQAEATKQPEQPAEAASDQTPKK